MNLRNELSKVSRRDLLKLSAAGVMGASTSGWALPRLAYAAEGRAERPRACIMLHMQGGVSQHHTFTVPQYRAQNEQIQTAVPGVHFCEYFPRLAAHMGDLCLIRGMNTGNSIHERARVLMHTGHNPGGATLSPSVGNIASEQLGAADAELPNFVALFGGVDGDAAGAYHRSVPAYLGPRHAPVPINDASRGLENLRASIDRRAFDDGAQLLDDFENILQNGRTSTAAAAHQSNIRRALHLMNSQKMRAFEIEHEPYTVRNGYTDTPFGRSLLLARRLVEAGVPFVEITHGGWDDHGGAYRDVRRRSYYVDPGISYLIDDLKQRGLFDSTLIVFMSEFGRGPHFADTGYNQTLGSGHYANAWTTFMAGGGTRGGTVIGRVDARGGEVTDRPVNAQDFLATMCHSLRIDYQKEYQTREGRPITFLPASASHVEEAF